MALKIFTCEYIDASQIKEYIEKGWNVTYLKPYCIDGHCCLATKEVEDEA